MSLNLKCYVKLNFTWTSEIKAILITFVPSASEIRNRPIAGGVLDRISTDGIVQLMGFDKGGIYQIPLENIRVVDEWETNDGL